MDTVVYLKLFLHGITVFAWFLGIFISFAAIAKRKELASETGIDLSFYLGSVFITEILYSIGALMILTAMGFNVIQLLADLDFKAVYSLLSKFDITSIKVVGWIGWLGFIINRSISFLTPGYLLVKGGKRLPRYFFISAWTEIILEVFTSILVFSCLWIV